MMRRAGTAGKNSLVVADLAPRSPWLCSARRELAQVCPVLLHVAAGSPFDEDVDV